MVSPTSAQEKAQQQLAVAKHLLGVTFPLLQDKKLLLGVVTNLFNAVSWTMTALLQHDEQQKLIPPLPDSFEGRLALFRSRCLPRYNLNKDHFKLILTLKELQDLQVKSLMEFSREDHYVIWTEEYHLRALAPKEIEQYCRQAEIFLKEIDRILAGLDRK